MGTQVQCPNCGSYSTSRLWDWDWTVVIIVTLGWSLFTIGIALPICVIYYILKYNKMSKDELLREGYICSTCQYKFIPDPFAKPIPPNEALIMQANKQKRQQDAMYMNLQQQRHNH